jgi:hypothetical protein
MGDRTGLQLKPVGSIRPSGGVLQRKCACGSNAAGGECEACRKKKLQRKTMNSELDHRDDSRIPPIVNEALRSPGQPLDASARAFMEPRFGHDFSQVRVHTDSRAAESAVAVDALAYTVGSDIVFERGNYNPQTGTGRRLLAHELTHVLQQSGSGGLACSDLPNLVHERTADDFADRVVAGDRISNPLISSRGISLQRQPKKTPPKKATPAAASGPKLDLTPSKNGEACACLVVVHNDERNARKTAQLMHENCSYNLLFLQPDTGGRTIKLPGHTATGGADKKGNFDPNSMFPREIAEQCTDDEKTCRDSLATPPGKTDKQIETSVQKQFFLSVSDCSKAFSLPVIALHNNDIEDTKNYLANKDAQGVTDLKVDVDKSKPETGEDQVKQLKELLKRKFGGSVEKQLMTKKKTNIFRWCVGKDLSKCHIGDPDHPDNITWVTNEKDFEILNKKDINVALQSDTTTSKGSESEDDLSTLFLVLRDLIDERLGRFVERLDKESAVDWKEVERIQQELEQLAQNKDLTLLEHAKGILDILRLLIEILGNLLLRFVGRAVSGLRLDRLRFVNVEAPGKALADQTGAERVRNYEALLEVLEPLELHCCGKDTAAADKRIREGLNEPSK